MSQIARHASPRQSFLQKGTGCLRANAGCVCVTRQQVNMAAKFPEERAKNLNILHKVRFVLHLHDNASRCFAPNCRPGFLVCRRGATTLSRKNLQGAVPGQLRHASGAPPLFPAIFFLPLPRRPLHTTTPAVLLPTRSANPPLHRLLCPPSPLLCSPPTHVLPPQLHGRGGGSVQGGRTGGWRQGAARPQRCMEQVT